MKTLLTTTAAALLIAGTAYAQDPADPATDMTGQTTIDQQGTTGMGGVDGTAGTDTFDQWDTNQDQFLSREEYEAGVNADPNPEQYPSWDELSADRADDQGRISRQDYEDAISKSDPADATTTGTSESLGE